MESIESFLTFVRRTLRGRQMSLRTEEAYLLRIRQFIIFHGKRHPRNLTPGDVRHYLTHLSVEGEVAASTQNVARSPPRPPMTSPSFQGESILIFWERLYAFYHQTRRSGP